MRTFSHQAIIRPVFFAFWLIVTAILGLSACSTTTYESYRPVKNAKTDIAFVAASADFSKYSRLMGEEMGIFYPSHASVSEQDLTRVRSAFRESFLAELTDYQIVDKPAKDVLKISISLVDLRGTAADRLPQLSREINEILKPGKLTFVIEMSDSLTGNAILRAADTQRSPAIDLAEDGSASPDEVRAAAEYWAQLLRSFLDKNLRGRG
jgi:Protein of unknown function (DUF3313)